ncbi:hypothetical protein [Thalassobellus sediminis]|uniref:hypothetical protein n=1 Tax=Thalassobellus sediminis TaxID=3367753 RepID=UPI003792D3A1
MRRSIISILLSTIFVVLLVAPTVILLVDDSIDITTFYASSEEEEKGIEKSKDKEVFFSEYNSIESDFALNVAENNVQYYFKKYAKPNLNLISPPPDHNIL